LQCDILATEIPTKQHRLRSKASCGTASRAFSPATIIGAGTTDVLSEHRKPLIASVSNGTFLIQQSIACTAVAVTHD